MMTFLEAVARREISGESLGEYIDQWHRSETDVTLHEYLGMSLVQYSQWVHDPGCLWYIVQDKRRELGIK